MNWGKGIVIGLGLFMSFVICLVVLMFQAPDDSFDKDYYEKGLAYDQEYNQKKQVLIDSVAPIIKLQENNLLVEFAALDSGELQMLRPSNHLEDKNLKLADKLTVFNTEEFSRGEWKLIAKWKVNNKEYLYEKSIFIQ